MPLQPIPTLILPADGRQSETACAIARGTARLLRSLGFSCVSELPLPSGRRADLVALNERGEIWIVEIKSSVEDLRADQKWPDYRLHCDRLFFAFTAGSALRDVSRRDRPDRRRRLWRAPALRGAGAPAGGADPQADDGAVRLAAAQRINRLVDPQGHAAADDAVWAPDEVLGASGGLS